LSLLLLLLLLLLSLLLLVVLSLALALCCYLTLCLGEAAVVKVICWLSVMNYVAVAVVVSAARLVHELTNV
jgi:hypothetical protein